jgi:hypothetical protein
MKYRNKIKRLNLRQTNWDNLSNKQGTTKPGSFKKC